MWLVLRHTMLTVLWFLWSFLLLQIVIVLQGQLKFFLPSKFIPTSDSLHWYGNLSLYGVLTNMEYMSFDTRYIVINILEHFKWVPGSHISVPFKRIYSKFCFSGIPTCDITCKTLQPLVITIIIEPCTHKFASKGCFPLSRFSHARVRA